MGYYYVLFSRMIDARIHGEMQRVDPRVFARPFELHRGQSLTAHQLVDRLNDLGYSNRPKAALGGEFTIGRDALVIVPKDGSLKEQQVRVVFGGKRAKDADPAVIERIEVVGTKATPADLTLGAPLITALVPTGREKRRDVPLAAIPAHMINAVLAIEDRRFYEHPGIDPIAISAAVFSNVFGKSEYTRGGSTLTQQLVKNTFLTQERTLRRKMTEWFMSVVLERRLSKPQILELYLNDVWLGQRGSFAIHGVGEAARLFFGKDISNLSLTEAATIAGTIQSPPRLSPFNNPDRSRERRNVVLHAMADSGFITADDADRACREPLQVVARALEAEAPYFVDYVSQEIQDRYKQYAGSVDVYTTLDLHLQRVAQDAVRDGLTRVDEILAKRKRQRAQAALIARRSAHRRNPGAGRRPFVQPVAVQPRHCRASSARVGVQAVRVPRGLRARTRGWPHRRDAGDGHAGRADDLHVQRSGMEPGQLRRRVRGPGHAAPCARAVPQHRGREGGGGGRLRSRRGAVAQGRRRHSAAAVSVDRARRLRSHAHSRLPRPTRSSPMPARCARSWRSSGS